MSTRNLARPVQLPQEVHDLLWGDALCSPQRRQRRSERQQPTCQVPSVVLKRMLRIGEQIIQKFLRSRAFAVLQRVAVEQLERVACVLDLLRLRNFAPEPIQVIVGVIAHGSDSVTRPQVRDTEAGGGQHHRGRVPREAQGAMVTPASSHESLSEVFFHTTTSQRCIGQSPRLRTHREIDWWRGHIGAGLQDRPSAPGGVR